MAVHLIIQSESSSEQPSRIVTFFGLQLPPSPITGRETARWPQCPKVAELLIALPIRSPNPGLDFHTRIRIWSSLIKGHMDMYGGQPAISLCLSSQNFEISAWRILLYRRVTSLPKPWRLRHCSSTAYTARAASNTGCNTRISYVFYRSCH